MAMWNSMKSAAFVIVGVAALGACAPTGGGNVVSSQAAGQVSEVEYGTVIDARAVVIQGENNGVGAAAGVVAGAAAGSQIGGGQDDRIAAGVAGAVVGGLVGNEVEKAVDRQNGIQYTVRLQSGRTIVVTQGNNPMIPIGARVQVVYDSNGQARVQQTR